MAEDGEAAVAVSQGNKAKDEDSQAPVPDKAGGPALQAALCTAAAHSCSTLTQAAGCVCACATAC